MPEELIKEGYTGKSIANQLKDKLNNIKENAKIGQHKEDRTNAWKREDIIPSWQREDIGVSVNNFSIKSFRFLFYAIKRLFKYKEKYISGEIQKSDSIKYKIVVRYDGKVFTSKSIDKIEIQDNLLDAAEVLYEKFNPERLAFYFFNQGNEDKTEEIINTILQKPTKGKYYEKILILAARLKCNQKKYEETIKYLESLGL